MKKYVYWLEELGKDDIYVAGKKCCNLGEMKRAGLTVPPGFALSLDAYERFIRDTGLADKILDLVKKNMSRLQSSVEAFEEISEEIRSRIEAKEMPDDLKEEILSHYRVLCEKCQILDVAVAVRSSGPVSMPGQFDTHLNVRGEEDLLKKVIKVWASSFNGRAMAYRMQRNMPVESSPIGVAVLKMVNAKASGVMFTLDPVNGDRSRIFIEGSWGLGESLVSGSVNPDKYIVDKVTMEITNRIICEKEVEMVYGPSGGIVAVDVPPERRNVPCLTDEEVLELARLGKALEKHFGRPQDVEWGIDKDLPFPRNVILLQTRPETIWSKKEVKPVAEVKSSALEHIASRLIAGFKVS